MATDTLETGIYVFASFSELFRESVILVGASIQLFGVVVAKFALGGRQFTFEALFVLFPFTLELVNFFLEYLNVQLELLLYLDVVADFALVLLQLLLVLFWRQGQALVCAREVRRGYVVAEAQRLTSTFLFTVGWIILVIFEFHLHENLNAGADVVENGETVKLRETLPLS